MNFEIEFYETENGREPAKEFILSLEPKMQAKMLHEIDLLKENGIFLREPHTKMIEKGIYEIRAKQGSNISRVLYFFTIGQRIILTNGFIKKTQKTPKRYINYAKQCKKDYEARHTMKKEEILWAVMMILEISY